MALGAFEMRSVLVTAVVPLPYCGYRVFDISLYRFLEKAKAAMLLATASDANKLVSVQKGGRAFIP